jgi:hypothetical protein
MPGVKLFSPLVRVILQNEDESEPKATDVQTTNADLVLWDRTRSTHKWPKFDDAPFLWLTFLAWSAMRRNGQIPTTLKYEEFERRTLSIENIDESGETVDPIQPEAAPG